MRVKVRYKDYNYSTGEVDVRECFCGSWDEESSYTILYDGCSKDTASFIIPTNNVVWIKIIRD